MRSKIFEDAIQQNAFARRRRFLRPAAPDHPELYAIAKKITLDAGYPYTDPRTLETTQPKTRKKKMSNSKKIPKWILLDQLHIDINIKSDMPAKERKELVALVNSKPMMSLFRHMIIGPNRRDNVLVEISK
jgi:hypothetical protein